MSDCAVKIATLQGDGFRLTTATGPIDAAQVVLAAGLGNAALAPRLGLSAPVRAQRGQIVALERMPPLLPLPVETLRQTDAGTVLAGDSQEEIASTDTSTGVLSAIAARAVRAFPATRGRARGPLLGGAARAFARRVSDLPAVAHRPRALSSPPATAASRSQPRMRSTSRRKSRRVRSLATLAPFSAARLDVPAALPDAVSAGKLRRRDRRRRAGRHGGGDAAADLGLDVVLLDEQSAPGGQVYRDLATASPQRRKALGPEYEHGVALRRGARPIWRASYFGLQACASVARDNEGFRTFVSQSIARRWLLQRPAA